MANYDYSLLTNFPNGLDNNQLINEINASPSIEHNCYNVSTDGDLVKIWFYSSLSSPEITELNNIVTAHLPIVPEIIIEGDTYIINNILNKSCAYSLQNRSTSSGSDQLLSGSYTLIAGSLQSFSDGVFTAPQTGLYMYSLALGNDNTSLNTSYRIIIKDASNNIINSRHSTCPTLSVWSDFIGSGKLMLAGDQLKLYVNLNNSSNLLNISFRVALIMSGTI